MSSIKHLDFDDPEGQIRDLDESEEVSPSLEPKKCNLPNSDEIEENETVKRFDFESLYVKKGKPDTFNHKVVHPRTLKETELTISHNDPFLIHIKPIHFYGKSINNIAKTRESWNKKSGFNKETHEFEDFVESIQSKHGHTEGGKGLTFYMSPIIYQHTGMSTINSLWIDSPNHFVVKQNGQPVLFRDFYKNKVEEEIQSSKGDCDSVTHRFDMGLKQVNRYTTSGGRIFDVTPDHEFPVMIGGKLVLKTIQDIYEQKLTLMASSENPAIIPDVDSNGFDLIYPSDFQEKESMKHIKGYEGRYGITNHGRVWVFNKSFRGTLGDIVQDKAHWLILTKSNVPKYCKVSLQKSGCKMRNFFVHRLVALHFIDNPLGLPYVNHKDGDKFVNYSSNLEWVTSIQNSTRVLKKGLVKRKYSEFYGITKDSRLKHGRKIWQASCCINEGSTERTYIGSATTAEKAAILYDNFIKGNNYHLAPWLKPLNFDIKLHNLILDPAKHSEYKGIKVVSCESLGVLPTSDIEIHSEDHLYELNGVLVHNCVNISYGCPSACSFCKESSLAREFSQMDLFEKTGIIKVKGPKDEDLEIPSRAKVKFWDKENEIMVLGPIEIAIDKGFPIALDSLQGYLDKTLMRVLAE